MTAIKVIAAIHIGKDSSIFDPVFTFGFSIRLKVCPNYIANSQKIWLSTENLKIVAIGEPA
jgi:hypothetical protein